MVGELIADRYEVEELVGTGGMSSVFKARDRMLERPVALKILHEHYTDDPEYVERFRREARAVAQLAHPNIVTVIDRGEQGGRQFIVFEYVEGENLKRLIEREATLEIREALELALQVGRALAFAHQRGIVHRDVKPQNVLLNEDGRAKVTDFGIARSLDVEGVTQTGTVVGTSDYIAPEQAQGQHVEARTDLYALGVVLYELLTGELPFGGESFLTVAMRHINDPIPSVRERRPDCPPRLDAAVRRAMAKRPEDRFSSMDEFVAELEACLAEEDGGFLAEGATLVVPTRARRRAPRRRPLGRVLLVLVLVALLAALAAAAVSILDFGDNGATNAPQRPVNLRAVQDYDPEGGDGEHPEAVARATDRDPDTYWPTEDYDTFQKTGVGLILDAGRPVALAKLTVMSDLSGFPAKIRASNARSGFVDVSREQTVHSRTTFALDTKGESYRYYLIWLRLPDGGVGHVNEVRAG